MSTFNTGRPRQIAARYMNEDDTIPPSGTPGGGSVTTVNTGTGLTGGPISGTGTISLASNAVLTTDWSWRGVGGINLGPPFNGLSVASAPPGAITASDFMLHFTQIKQKDQSGLVLVEGEIEITCTAPAIPEVDIDFAAFLVGEFPVIGADGNICPPLAPRPGVGGTVSWSALQKPNNGILEVIPVTGITPTDYSYIRIFGTNNGALSGSWKFWFKGQYKTVAVF